MTTRLVRLGAAGALWLLITIAPCTAFGAPASTAGVPVAVKLGPGSSLWLNGTSTMHDFECRTSETEIAMTRDAALGESPADAGLPALVRTSTIRTVDVTVPVGSLHSEKSGLDKNLRKTLKADQFKTITVHLERYTLPAKGAKGDTIALHAEGTITVAGEQRPITLEGRMYPGSGGMWLEGSHQLRMTELGIKPPTMMLGTVRVGDQITVHYRLLLAGRDGAGSPSANSGH